MTFTIIALAISLIALFFSWRADRRQKRSQEREEKSSKLAIKPVVQARPIQFSMGEEFGAVILEVNNPSGYDAYDVHLDIKYGNNDWISEWLKANHQPTNRLNRLPSGNLFFSDFNGALPQFENDKVLFIIEIRTQWRNEFMQFFENITKYQLHRTTVNGNHSITFIPCN